KKGDTTLLGGDWLSRELNLYSGRGSIFANVGEVTGKLNNYGRESHVYTDVDTLTLGNVCMTGDPTFYNTGNITINGNLDVGSDLSILAGGDITTTSGVTLIRARSGGGDGRNITIVAGANLSNGGTTSPTLPGGTAAAVDLSPTGAPGGNIDFTASSNLAIVG